VAIALTVGDLIRTQNPLQKPVAESFHGRSDPFDLHDVGAMPSIMSLVLDNPS